MLNLNCARLFSIYSYVLAQHWHNTHAPAAQGRHISTVGYIRQHIPNRIESQSVRWVLGNVSRKTRRDEIRAAPTRHLRTIVPSFIFSDVA